MRTFPVPFLYKYSLQTSVHVAGFFFPPSGNRLGSKTFKPRKNITEKDKQHDLLVLEAAATLGSGDLRQAVQLPEGEDLHEWIAINTVDFYNQINMLYGTLIEFCTEESCPVMSAGSKYEYHWADGQTVKKPLKCSAPHYINCLMGWIQQQLENEAIFPSKIGAPFPRDFLNVVKVILKRLFRVYAHIYHQHFSEVRDLQEEAHLNTSFKHFVFFVMEFDLVQKRELAPLQQLIDLLTGTGLVGSRSSNGANAAAAAAAAAAENSRAGSRLPQ
ncbi:Mob as tumor suppressor [Fasciolopsis buskii]|uniref:Mob as tumor suppressor n=1 Tax=Fasciolopsis buskii TaxID=27845 RepID=A0A8E0VF62_9TREM|nr:Mob as tumor suppressor [Fasciolopsis buski]